MINLDNNYDQTEAKEGGTYTQPPAGGHVLIVTGVSEKPSGAGNDMVTLDLDIRDGEHAGAFAKFPKKFFQLVNGEHTPYFKAMIKHFRDSNSAHIMNNVIQLNRDGTKAFNAPGLVGCVVGANLRDTEYIHKASGETRVGLEVAFLCAVKDVAGQKVLPLKKLVTAKSTGVKTQLKPTYQGEAAPQANDDLPF